MALRISALDWSSAPHKVSNMGIQSRDYMKRTSDGGSHQPSSPDDQLEAFLSGFLRKHPRFFIYLGIGIVFLILLGLFVAKFSRKA